MLAPFKVDIYAILKESIKNSTQRRVIRIAGPKQLSSEDYQWVASRHAPSADVARSKTYLGGRVRKG